MKKHRPLSLLIIIVLAASIAYGLFSLPSPQPVDHQGFSSARVVEDLKVIAAEPHSVAHPQEREKVLQYLVQRLEELGGNPKTHVYPNIKARKFTFDATNVSATFPPKEVTDSTTYLMMIAHYDSRYPWKLLEDTVTSSGAADDGYGLGVILETARQALACQKEWTQGLKILFTDAEEVDLQGMKAAYANQKELFENVGLVINVEARGPFGPALLFETSPDNDRLMEFYTEHARYPFTYSLTNVVYQYMPNGTDFNIVKDSIPGMNFSSIADINHYHTDLDNIHHVNETTIQHYGEQITPLVTEYLTNPIYADKNYFRGEDNAIFFSIPAWGMCLFSPTSYWLLNIGILLLLLHEFRKERAIDLKKLARSSGILFGSSLAWLLLGEVIAWLSACSVGAKFKWFGVVQGIPSDNAIIFLSLFVLTGSIIWSYRKQKTIQALYTSLFILQLLSLIFLATMGENMVFFLPLCSGTLTLVLWKATSARIFPLVGLGVLLIHAFSFVYVLSMALTIGALGIVLLVAFYHLIVLVPLAKGYLADKASNETA